MIFRGRYKRTSAQRPLAPRYWHRRLLAVPVAARVGRPVLEPGDEAHQLLDRLLVGLPSLLRAGQLRLAQHARFAVAAGPRDERGRPGLEQVHPVEGTLLLVKADGAVLDLVLAHVVAIQVEVERRFQLAGVGAAAGELALP